MVRLTIHQWETLITHRGPYDPCPGVQLVVTALLGQVYGALSKVSYHDPVTTSQPDCGIESSYTDYKSSIPCTELLLGKTMLCLRKGIVFCGFGATLRRFG